MTNKGIDYGLGKTNIDHDTGIRFGVIPVNHALQAWSDSSEPHYPEPVCEDCGTDLTATDDDTYVCPECSKTTDADVINDCLEPTSWYVDDGEYLAESDDHGDIFITKSPYFTYAQLCSPCAPGACYLPNPVEPDFNNKCYALGHDWFDDGEAPYKVYSVETGKEVQPEPDYLGRFDG